MNIFSTDRISADLLQALSQQGISEPTEVQNKSIDILLDHKGDFVCRSATGTGKTFAYGIPLLSRIIIQKEVIQGIVLVPTRELCDQVAKELIALGTNIEGLHIMAVYGGIAIKDQLDELNSGNQVIVATPGRLLDLIERKVINIDALEYLVFDEADEMLSKGFIEDIDLILAKTESDYRSWLFSATMPNRVNKMVAKYLNHDLMKVMLGDELSTNKGIIHKAIIMTPEDKLNVLLHYLTYYGSQAQNGEKGIVFCRTKSGVQKLYKQLSANGFSSGAIHGNLPQGLRNKVMTQFKEGHISLLIATDVAARGVDVENVAYVIQYHIPDTTDAYTHRSGRTARVGETGISLSFLFEEEEPQMKFIDEALQLNLEYLSLPSYKDQAFNRALLNARKIAKQKPIHVDDEALGVFKNTLAHMSKDEILVKLLSYLMENKVHSK